MTRLGVDRTRPTGHRRFGAPAVVARGSAALRVGFDVSCLSAPGDGIGRYTYQLLAALWSEDADRRVIALGNRRLPDGRLPANGDPVVAGPRCPSRAAWTFGLLPLWLRGAGVNVFHATSYYAPLWTRIPTVVTLHDMSVLACPEYQPPARVLRARVALAAVARHATAIIAPSEATRRETVRWLGVPVERIHVIPEAPAPFFRPVGRPVVAEVLLRYGLEPGYFLALGTIEPRKNLERTLDAVDQLRREGTPVRLVVVGRLGWKYRPVLDRIARLGLSDLVRLTGFVPDDDLPALMSGAAALVYPSLYEGFGLPIVEAMASGLPVLTSDRGALAEVAGDAALVVDPTDAPAIAAGMRALLDDGLRMCLRAAGLRRASGFTWQRSARGTLAVYRAVGQMAEARG